MAAPRKRGGGKARIIAAAVDQFAEHGFDGTSTIEIARAAKVSQSVILYHFATKEELWQEAMRTLFQSVDASAIFRNDIYADLSTVDRFNIMLRQFVITSARHPQIGKIIFREGLGGGSRLEWLIGELIMPQYETFFLLIRKLMEEGKIHPVDPVVATLAIHGAGATLFNLHHLSERLMGRKPDWDEIAEAQADLLVRVFTKGLLV